ncbi:hypothetical protein SUGI_0713050 [Cryptomeria japonica]|nr:hypothetical protein SUGI_0713050 [Cryptomeria japonica]
MAGGEPSDVFINRRRPDIKAGIASILYDSLRRKNYPVFLDRKSMHVGSKLETMVFLALRSVSLNIVIISKNYANSDWCLNELVEILNR